MKFIQDGKLALGGKVRKTLLWEVKETWEVLFLYWAGTERAFFLYVTQIQQCHLSY